MLHSVKSPEMGWQRAYGKGKHNPGPAEAAYDEAEAALTSLMTADAALHPVVGSSTDGAGGKRGKGASSLGLDVHRDFMKGKKGGKGVPSIDGAQEREGAPDVDDAEYEEEVEEEEEEVVEDDEALVEVELEVIPEEEEEDHDEERCEDPSLDLGENEEPTYSEAEHTEAFDDGQGPVSEPEAEEGDHSEAMASSGATAPPNFTTESLKRTTEGRSLGRPVEFPKALFLGPKILVASASKMSLTAFWPPNKSTSLVADCEDSHDGPFRL